jgi:transcription antitermination factor NusG
LVNGHNTLRRFTANPKELDFQRNQMNMNPVPPWFALQTRPRHEKKIDRLLRQKGYECLTPMYRQKRKWSDRTVEVELPLFPMYVFCRLSSSVLGKAISTSGVIKIVGFNGRPAEVDTDEIEALQRLMLSNLLREPWKYLCGGTQVLIETGPLAGIQGIMCDGRDNRKRLILSITLLERSVAIRLDEDTVISVVADLQGNKTGQHTESSIANTLLRRR